MQPPHGVPLDRGNLVLEGAQHLEIWGSGDAYGACKAANGVQGQAHREGLGGSILRPPQRGGAETLEQGSAST